MRPCSKSGKAEADVDMVPPAQVHSPTDDRTGRGRYSLMIVV